MSLYVFHLFNQSIKIYIAPLQDTYSEARISVLSVLFINNTDLYNISSRLLLRSANYPSTILEITVNRLLMTISMSIHLKRFVN